jgi:DNA repair protein RecN (Recombination protein N)
VLCELVIENYAVIDRLRVRFHPGLNLLTGETGSGKSIVVDALALLLGARASAAAIRAGEERCRVAGIFDIGGDAALQSLLDKAGFAAEDGELLIEREILASGKSRAFVGSRPAAASLLRELAPALADIHGQHEQQLLFSTQAQREMLDAFAQSGPLLERLRETFQKLQAAAREIEDLERAGQERLRMLDLWRFQRGEIRAAAPQPGEDEALETERKVLRNLGRVQEAGAAAFNAIYDDPESALARLRLAEKRVEEIARIDPALGPAAEALRTAGISIVEASDRLRDYLGDLESSPGRLEEVEARLAALDRLKRKYGGSIEETLRFLDEAEKQIDGVEQAGERLPKLSAEHSHLSAVYEDLASELSGHRQKAARKLEKQVAGELAGLAMPGTQFVIATERCAWSEAGFDAVSFLVSPNPGEAPGELEKVASGGEISRIALALKTCLAATGRKEDSAPRTLVFDEVDAGIGGRAAEGVGRRLQRLAVESQVLCVTHLPQIAAFASHHYVVEKKQIRGRTVTGIEELDAPGRTRELGRMLSGETVTPEALKHAERLKEEVRSHKP